MPTPAEVLEACVQKLLELLSCQGHVSIDSTVTPVRVTITTQHDSRHLIGMHGQHLQALQHLIRAMVRKTYQADILFVLDINGYRSQHEETMKVLAEKVAQEATGSGRTVVLEPMSPADRRLIHTSLAERSDIRTESLGDEPNRRVVVRPVFL